MTAEQIKHMVNRFLGWRLPENFRPDTGISFTPEYNVEFMANQGKPPMRHQPNGTNLFDAQQAEVMVRYMIDRMPKPIDVAVRERAEHLIQEHCQQPRDHAIHVSRTGAVRAIEAALQAAAPPPPVVDRRALREAVRSVLDKLTEPGVRTLDSMVDELMAVILTGRTDHG